MSKVSIVSLGLKELDLIENKLKERDAQLKILQDIKDLKVGETDVLLCGEEAKILLGGDNELLALARNLKINKIILIEKYSNTFSFKKELGGSIIKLSLIPNDKYCLELILSLCLQNQKFITGSKESFVLKNLAKKVALTDVTVFINGPTGTGKEVVANYIHENSSRKEKPFVAVNCAAIPENMLEAILFGHEKGSFTGASNANKGIFRAADNGTLLLDEISEMPISLQAKLLRVLQERKVTPVGSHRDIEVNVRIIATTNRDMSSEVKKNNFREDLYYRLNVFPIRTYNLCARPEDIIPITVSMIKKHAMDKDYFPYLTSKAQEKLTNHKWAGNVRELENIILRALVLSNGSCIEESHIMIDESVENNNKFYQQLEEKIVAVRN